MTLPGLLLLAALLTCERVIPIQGQEVRLLWDSCAAQIATCERRGKVSAGMYVHVLRTDGAVDWKLAEQAIERGADTVVITKRWKMLTYRPRKAAQGVAYRCSTRS